jgi:transcriptional regulator of heat shock response
MPEILLNLRPANHLSPTILRKFLKIFNFLMPSLESASIQSLSVMSIAALYATNMTNGDSKLKSIDFVPCANSSTVLVIVESVDIREVVAIELQFSVKFVIKGTLLPFSNASRRALF